MRADHLGHDWLVYDADGGVAECVLCRAWLDEPEGRAPCSVTEPPDTDDPPWPLQPDEH